MRRSFVAAGLAGAMLLGGALGALAEDVTVPMKSIGLKSAGDTVGHIDLKESADGVQFTLRLRDVPQGENWVLLSEGRNCPDKLGDIAGERLGMVDTSALATGEVANKISFDSPGLKLADLKQRALLVVHEAPAKANPTLGDTVGNYKQPTVACGTLR